MMIVAPSDIPCEPWDVSRYSPKEQVKQGVELYHDLVLDKDVVVTKLTCQWTKDRSPAKEIRSTSSSSTSSTASSTDGNLSDKSTWSRSVTACRTSSGEVVLVAPVWDPEADLWSFSQSLGRAGPEREARVTQVMSSLVSEVRRLHNHGLAHGNLCLEAVLLKGWSRKSPEDGVPSVMLTDFVPMEQGAFVVQEPSGKSMYVAPEAHKKGSYDSRAADLFACGVIAYCLMVGEYPFMNTAKGGDKAFSYLVEHGAKALMKRRKVLGVVGNVKVPVIDTMTDGFAEAVSQLLSLDPEERAAGVTLFLAC